MKLFFAVQSLWSSVGEKMMTSMQLFNKRKSKNIWQHSFRGKSKSCNVFAGEQ